MRRITRLVALVGILALFGCSDSLTGPTPRVEAPAEVDQPAAADPTVPAAPAFPPTAALAFASNRDGSPHIYVANADGSEVTRITEGSSPAWAWDGRRIVFVGRPGGLGPSGIHVVGSNGSVPQYLGPGLLPTWSPDGRIAFSSSPTHPPSLGLYVMNANGSGRTELLAPSRLCASSSECRQARHIIHPTWSPDGGSMAFLAEMTDWDRGIGIVNADRSDPRLFEELLDVGEAISEDVNSRAAWSPDGSQIAVITGNPWMLSNYPHTIYTYRIASGDLDAIHTAPGMGVGGAPTHPEWSPDGTRIAFDASSHDGDPRTHRRIFTVSVETGEVRQLIPEAGPSAVPDYSDYGAVWSRVTR